jgi:large-conductance mechanosensitive channel
MGVIGKTILEHDFIWLTIAVFAGGVLQDFFQSLITDILWPIINGVFGFDQKVSNDIATISGINILYGNAVKQLFRCVISGMIVYVFLKGIHKL